MGFDVILPFLHPIESLILDPEISEIMVNGSSRVFVESRGEIRELPDTRIPEKSLQVAVRNIARLLGDEISEEKPILDSRLPDGSRVAAVFPACSVGGTTLTIRKFHSRFFTVDELVRIGTLTWDLAIELENAVESKQNILISGGTGTGKTTLLNALSAFIPESERIIVIEETAEIQVDKSNLVRFEARRELAAELARRGAKVFYAEIPAEEGVNGIDHYLYRHGPEDALKLISAATEYVPMSDLPALDAGDQSLERATAGAWHAIELANVPAFLFRRSGETVRIERDEDGAPLIRDIGEDHMRHILARVAFYFAKDKDGKARPALPPLAVVKDLLVTPFKPLPVLSRIVEAPVFGRDGTLQTEPGYHPSSRTYYAPAEGFTVPAVSAQPTDAEMAEVLRLIDLELLGQFPFTGDAEKAHALALLLLPFAREFIHGPTPLHLFEKPCPGTGASLLVDVLTYPATGRTLAAMTEGRDEDEWRKRITSKLVSGAGFVLIDNLRRRLDSSAVSAAITAGTWEDRRMGHTQILRVPVRCAWCATGNNVAVSNEIARRTVRIRLDAKTDRPWLREGFKHPDLREWTAANRAQLVWAALTIIRRWVFEGRPRPGKVPKLGMFESWSEVMAGILHTACIPGLLSNLEDFYDDADAETEAWRAFVQAWWTRYQQKEVDVSDLYPLADSLELGDGGERSQKTRLGKQLSACRDRAFGELRVVKRGLIAGRRKWQLRDTKEA